MPGIQELLNSRLQGNKVAVNSKQEPAAYRLSQIYDPDVDTEGPNASGKYIPALGSLVTDDTSGNHTALYVVVAVNADTYKATLLPVETVLSAGQTTADKLYDYGNRVYQLYYTPVTVTNRQGLQENVNHLVVDDRLVLFATDAVAYYITKNGVNITRYMGAVTDFNDEGLQTELQTQLNAGATDITIAPVYLATTDDRGYDTDNTSMSKCAACECSSTVNFTDSDQIIVHFIDKDQNEVTKITLLAKASQGNVPLTSLSVVNFDVECNQYLTAEDTENLTLGNPLTQYPELASASSAQDVFKLIRGQDVRDLTFYPKITLSNGQTYIASVDNKNGFVYGLDEVNSNTVGAVFNVTFKYYLPAQLKTNITQEEIEQGNNSVLATGRNYVAVTKKILVVQSTGESLSKVSLIPLFSSGLNQWTMAFAGYDYGRASRLNVKLGADDAFAQESGAPFNGTGFGEEYAQSVKLSLANVVVNGSAGSSYVQKNTVTLFMPEFSVAENQPATNFKIKDYGNTSVVYGNSNTGYHRPIIARILDENDNPTYRFKFLCPVSGMRAGVDVVKGESMDATLAQMQVFLTNYYYNANPPKLPSELLAPVPTHWNLFIYDPNPTDETKRWVPAFASIYSDGSTITYPAATPKPLYKINTELLQEVRSLNLNNNDTLLLEFYRIYTENGAAKTETLYGVPITIVHENFVTSSDR